MGFSRDKKSLLCALQEVVRVHGPDIPTDQYDRIQMAGKPARTTLARCFGSYGAALEEAVKAGGRQWVPLSANIAVEGHDGLPRVECGGEGVAVFGVLGCTHFGSTSQQLSHVRDAYRWFEEHEVPTVFHNGDVMDGWRMRPGHEQELFLHGADEQEQYTVENYPRVTGIHTHLISGNHDYSLVKLAGHDSVRAVCRCRSDLTYLGVLNAVVELAPGITVEINHPLDGSAYALSYSAQKYADSMTGGQKPSVLLNGHHHKFLYFVYRNIQILETGCVQAQTKWMKGKRLAAHMCATIVRAEFGGPESGAPGIRSFTVTQRPYYDVRARDW